MKKSLITMIAATSLLSACALKDDGNNIITRPEVTVTDGQFSIDVLEALGRVSNPVVSPDGKKILYGVSFESVEQNKSNNELWVMNIDGSDAKQLTKTPSSEYEALWYDGGKRIAFIYQEQVWTMSADGSDRCQASDVEGGVSGFVISPDGSKIILICNVKYSRTAQDVYPDLPEATGRIIDDLMYKHWDEWVTEIPHPFLANFDGRKVSEAYDIMADEPFEAPMKPFGGSESFAWAPDSKSFVYVSRKKTGLDYAISTNSNLYLYDIEAKTTTILTEGMNGYDTTPTFSPDGKHLAWLSMENDGYESDKNRIFILDLLSNVKTDLTADWDYSVDKIAWNPSGRSIYFIAPHLGVIPVFSIDVASREITTVATGTCDYAAIVPVDETNVVTLRHSMLAPNEVYMASIDGSEPVQLTNVNTELLSQVSMPSIEKVLVPTTDGKEMTTWVVLPPNFDPTKKYPAILYCQGGPQSPVSQFWSYRWNLALMAANGYIVIAPNRRGLPGFGTEWNAQISGDYGGQNMKDYLSAVDYVKQRPYVDVDHIGAVGASYGGFSVYWLAGNHEGRFACLIAHAGIFNTEAQYLETEEMWFANWDLGGPFWDTSNAVAQKTFANSPHRFVDRWTAPILVTHGELDYRILASQGEMAFNAARLRGVPAEMVIFPDENHWILKPQNAVLWQRVFFRWLDRWLKTDTTVAAGDSDNAN